MDHRQGPIKTKVELSNLPPGIRTSDDIRVLCKDYGTVTCIDFTPSKNKTLASAVVTFKSLGDAENAVATLNSTNFGQRGAALKGKVLERYEDSCHCNFCLDPFRKPWRPKPEAVSLSTLTPKPVCPKPDAFLPTGLPSGEPPKIKTGWDLPPQKPEPAGPTPTPDNPPKNQNPPPAAATAPRNAQAPWGPKPSHTPIKSQTIQPTKAIQTAPNGKPKHHPWASRVVESPTMGAIEGSLLERIPSELFYLVFTHYYETRMYPPTSWCISASFLFQSLNIRPPTCPATRFLVACFPTNPKRSRNNVLS
jgi:hypothetical protein